MAVPSRAPAAIIDIGSNSVRLVVYASRGRVPVPIFNEKVLAGLGAGLKETGALGDEAQHLALEALARFRLLIRHMGVHSTRVVATAAVRDASNGPAFVRAIAKAGFACEVLSAEDEARLAGEGVLSAFPQADGIVGDLGGGSLELVELRSGAVGRGISLPLGVLRIKASENGEKRALAALRSALEESGLGRRGRGRPFYMVGGSWRALARIDMIASHYPLPITHNYQLAPKRVADLRKGLGSADPRWSRAIAPARLATSPQAAMLLALIARELEPSELIVSSFGIREGLLYDDLEPGTRELDPLIEAARDAGGAERRFGEHGDVLDAWIADAFDDAPAMRRLRLAACLLADVAWQANADFRADRGVEMAMHGNWVGVDAAGRVAIAQALSSNFGRDRLPDPALERLCPPDVLERARSWGLAIRLAQRLCGGVGRALGGTGLRLERRTIWLEANAKQGPLIGDAVRRRLERLAQALGKEAGVRLT
ncbi:MAG TPA: Ppx/GppA family phosphatase [Sphingomicrobium sp.]|nr:Ppx/GppA family phosphatase [Sphingomicrobium sp.]